MKPIHMVAVGLTTAMLIVFAHYLQSRVDHLEAWIASKHDSCIKIGGQFFWRGRDKRAECDLGARGETVWLYSRNDAAESVRQ